MCPLELPKPKDNSDLEESDLYTGDEAIPVIADVVYYFVQVWETASSTSPFIGQWDGYLSQRTMKMFEIENLRSIAKGGRGQVVGSKPLKTIYLIAVALLLFFAAQLQFIDYTAVKWGPIASSICTATYFALVLYGVSYKVCHTIMGAAVTAVS
ncbi:unnamed protein product [Heligmosomoides polygyrus]|uniref:Transmembrane protein n=1 Tax=Heligmosomoides polygyrus TaxID=6339 RepID=A0A183GEE3_HELPZ|nr:unnamed protein product [Heligmosomoides polygyrus]